MPQLPTWLRLSVTHLAFLAGVCGYVAVFFPAQHGMALAFLVGAGVGEAISWWRRIMIAEGLLVVTAIAVWWWFRPTTREEWHALLGLAMASWLLIPSRLGWLRWLVPLAALEVLYLGINAETPRMARLGSMALLPISLGALAGDAWLIATSGARSSARSRPPLFAMARWALAPAVAAVVIGCAMGMFFSRQDRPNIPNTSHAGPQAPAAHGPEGLRNPTIGDAGPVALNPAVCARMSWDGPEAPPGMVYLREMCFDLEVMDGDKVSWEAPDVAEARPVPRRVPPPANQAWVYKGESSNDVVLRPDSGGQIDLDELLGDADGNLFRIGFGESPRVYRCSLDDSPRAAAANEESRYLGITNRLLEYLPWQEIEAGQQWSSMRSEDAANAIASALGARCHYSLNPPEPMHGNGGALATFLFDKNLDNRCGHCQYFATAEALLLRHNGHPARLVTGYASFERDEDGVTFRGMNAHAWVEYIDSHHEWTRIDATPGDALRAALKDFSEGGLPPVNPEIGQRIIQTRNALPVSEHQRQATRSHQLQLAARAGVLALLVAVLALAVRRARRKRRDPRLDVLERRADDLFHLASHLGILVTPATTVSALTLRLQERTGMDLTRYRDAHLAARYGSGPIPEPWPYAQMREAAKQRRERSLMASGGQERA